MQQQIDAIRRLKQEKNAVILAHTYQPAAIQDVADFVGDSYGLSLKATQLQECDLIVFCGVSFMAETAAILNPDKTVIMPDPDAGCPMADMISAGQLRQFKAQHPGAKTVCYVNSTAAVKAESDVCCTSSNAVKIVRALGDQTPVIFVPDQFLGRFVEKKLGRPLILWNGYCPVHQHIPPDRIRQMRTAHPGTTLMVHPETSPEVQAQADHVLSTGEMLELVRRQPAGHYLVGTEEGILHALRLAAPDSEFIHLDPGLHCPDMKKTTPAKLLLALQTGQHRITVPATIAKRAAAAIRKMIELAEA